MSCQTCGVSVYLQEFSEHKMTCIQLQDDVINLDESDISHTTFTDDEFPETSRLPIVDFGQSTGSTPVNTRQNTMSDNNTTSSNVQVGHLIGTTTERESM